MLTCWLKLTHSSMQTYLLKLMRSLTQRYLHLRRRWWTLTCWHSLTHSLMLRYLHLLTHSLMRTYLR